MDWQHLLTRLEGRINRARFWAGAAVIVVIGLLAQVLDALLGIQLAGPESIGPVSLIAMLGSIYFALAIFTKRWHDRNKSGWWSLLILIPIIGPIWALIELGMLEGTRSSNRYGPDPLG